MYRVFSDSRCIYSSAMYLVGEYSKKTIIDPVLTLEDNTAGTFVFTIPKNHAAYSDTSSSGIRRMASEISVERATTNRTTYEKIWAGRVISEDVDFDGNRVLTCEGELNYLRDTRQPQKQYAYSVGPSDYMKALLSYHNSKVSAKKRIYFDTCEFGNRWVDSDGVATTDKGRNTSFEDTLTLIQNLATELKGHLKIRWLNGKRYLALYKNNGVYWPKASKQPAVRFGENLLDFVKKYDMSELATAIIPLGAKKDSTGEAGIGAVVFDQETASTAAYAKATILQANTNASPVIAAKNDIQEDDEDPTYYDQYTVYGPYSLRYSGGKLVDKYMFYTGRMKNGRCTYLIRNDNREILASGTGSSGQGVDDNIEQKIEIPEGATKMWIAGYGTDVPLRLNRYDESANDDLDDYVTVESVNKGSLYVSNSSLISTYGWIEKVVEFPTVTEPSDLLKKSKKYLRSDQFDDMTLEAKMIDRHFMNLNAAALKIGESIRIISKPHGLDKGFPITKMELHLLEPDQSVYTLGYEHKTQLSYISNETSSNVFEKITATDLAANDRLKEARAEAARLIVNATNGYVTLKKDPTTGRVSELIISDIEDYTDTRANVWRWNMGGLMFTTGGYNSFDGSGSGITVALTADGKINADAITTGYLNANYIQGGVLTMGGVGNGAGEIQILSGRKVSGGGESLMFIINNTGIRVMNPFTGMEVGQIRCGGNAVKNADGSITYNSKGAESFLMEGFNDYVIGSNGDMYLIPKNDGKLYTGDTQANAYNRSQYGKTIELGWNNSRLKFVNGILVDYVM